MKMLKDFSFSIETVCLCNQQMKNIIDLLMLSLVYFVNSIFDVFVWMIQYIHILIIQMIT